MPAPKEVTTRECHTFKNQRTVENHIHLRIRAEIHPHQQYWPYFTTEPEPSIAKLLNKGIIYWWYNFKIQLISRLLTVPCPTPEHRTSSWLKNLIVQRQSLLHSLVKPPGGTEVFWAQDPGKNVTYQWIMMSSLEQYLAQDVRCTRIFYSLTA